MIALLVILSACIQCHFIAEAYTGLASPEDVPCLECVCRASTACNDIYECAKKTIDKEYWSLAGENIAGGDDNRKRDSKVNYDNCVKDRICILNTMYYYTNRILRSLNGDVNCDGLVNCADRFAAHVFGQLANRPESKFSIGLSKRFDRCQGHGIKNVTNSWFPKKCSDL
ncbi:uncharacterized protein LOC123316801 [Coccinella septempunctata]|uniref:uncharacterized protein LOC123316801 n=1 Tax=Coccinella septempunctata TaxID=41139 RepID=UPI001D09297B|nr:uncharacterized protein LOC123316801 [Coccinella septempunctata]